VARAVASLLAIHDARILKRFVVLFTFFDPLVLSDDRQASGFFFC
jgi:hypothetical protein